MYNQCVCEKCNVVECVLMQTQAVSNIKPNIQFRAKPNLDEMAAFVNMNDMQLQELAYTDADKRDDRRAKRNIAATFIAMPIVDSIASGFLATEKRGEIHFITPIGTWKDDIKVPASMGKRLSRTAGTAIGWAFTLGVIGIYSAVRNKVVKDSPGMQNFEQEHPALSFVGDLALIVGTCILGVFGLSKLAEKAGNKYPKTQKELSEKLDSVFEDINKGKFNKRTLPRIIEWFEKAGKKAPALTKTGKFLLANSIWILLGAALTQMFVYGKNKHNNVEQRYQSLRTAQLDAAKHLVNTLDVEKDILSQNQKHLTDDLEKALSGENPVSKKEIKEINKHAKIYENEKTRIKAWKDGMKEQDSEPEVIQDIQIIKIIHIPDNKED